jgi:hypothetical protein
MTNTHRFATILGLAATFAGLSSAAAIGYKATFGPSTTEVTYSLELPKFDPLLGLLNSVTLYFSAAETTNNLTVTNTAPITETFDFSLSSDLVKNFANSATPVDNYTGETLQLFDTGSVTLAAGASVNYAPLTIHNTDSIFGLSAGTGIQGLFGVV